MNFDIHKFAMNIKKHDVKNRKIEDLSGLATVIRHIYNGDYKEDVDFNGFFLEDVLQALEAMYNIAFEETNDEEFFIDPLNEFSIWKTVDDAIFTLSNSTNKRYELDDEEEVFI